MPLGVGNWWEYQVTVETKGSPQRTYKVKYEITATKPNYKGRLAYVIEVTEDGTPQPNIMAYGRGAGATYLDRGFWAILIWDTISSGMWTETGLVVDFPLRCGGGRQTALAGSFDCVVLYFENANELKPESWREYYVENVGLVEYENYYKEYDTSIPPHLVDWRTVTYELHEYNINYE
jgi:hypothetical protein